MPDFTEILKIAVQEQDWQLVCGLYTNITGEPLSVPEEETEENPVEDVLGKEYSLEELKHQNQPPPQEQGLELEDKNIDKTIADRYNEFKAPPRNHDPSLDDNRRMRSESIGSEKLKNTVGVSEKVFVDDMTESLIDPNTGESLMGKNKDVKITPRNQRKKLGMNDTKLMDVVCAACNKCLSVSSVLAHGYSKNKIENSWKCNDCSTRKGYRERSRDN